MEMQQPPLPQCAICENTENVLRCAKCKSAYYCSTTHQHMDWPSHKQYCRTLAKQKKINMKKQQAIAPTANLNGQPTAAAATLTTFPTNPQESLMNTNGINFDEFADSFIDNAFNDNAGIVANANHMESPLNHNPSSSVIYDAKDENSLLNSSLFMSSMNGMDMQYQTTLQHPQQQQQQQQTYAQFRNQNSQHEKSSSYQIGQADENVMLNFSERRYEELCRNIINDMNQYGLSVVDDFLGAEKGMEILSEVHNMYCAGVFQDGQLVNNKRTEHDINRTIRGDKITWVKGVEPGCTSVGYLINQIDAVICRANTMKNNGKLGNYNIKERTKAMVACYPGSGTHYVTHVDNPNKDGRVITAIYYLNVDWDAKRSGGVLRIFPEAANTVADIEPKFDRLILFWSDKRNPHEVQPSLRTRYAITVWYFDADEREAALNRCKYGEVSKTASPTSSSKNPSHHRLQSEFSKANENSNPNLNTNFNTNSSQTNLHPSEICT